MAEATSDPRVVQIVVARAEITDRDKRMWPVPEIPLGEVFRIEVGWNGAQSAGLSLTLSEFRILLFDEGEAPKWRWVNDGEMLELLDANGNSLKDQKLDFKYSARESIPGGAKEGWNIDVWGGTSGEDRRDISEYSRKEVQLKNPGGLTEPCLIMFKQTVKDGNDVLFTHDPPWAKSG